MTRILQRSAPRFALLLTAILLFERQAHAQTVPVNFSGSGFTSFDGWVEMNNSNPGFSGWPETPAESNASGSGNAQLVRAAGTPIFSSESLYFSSYTQEANTLGGTLLVSDDSPVFGVKTITLQIEIGEALGYGFVEPSGSPSLKVNGAAVSYAPSYSEVIDAYQNGIYESPVTGEEPIYVKTWAFQWNIGNVGSINSIQIEFSAVTHATIYSMRLDQTSVLQSNNVFEAGSAEPMMSLSGAGLAFSDVVVGSRKTGALTISNTGNSPLNVAGISYPPGFSGEADGSSIPSGGSRDVIVTFAPDAARDFTGEISVSSDATAGENTVSVSGKGLAPAIKAHLAGTPLYDGAETTVTHTFHSTPATWLNLEFTDNLIDSNGWTEHSEVVYSGGGEFSVTFRKPGDHRINFQRGLFFRLSYPTQP